MIIRHTLGVLGVVAAGILLAVSATMNWSFGFSLGRTEFDGQIYGAASAAADCLKALVPFFFFAAVRNKMWSQAAASAIVWCVVTVYSLTSALGHAALNRFDTASQRTVTAQSYGDLRKDLTQAQEQLSRIPHHRPAAAVQADIDNMKNQRPWAWTKGCAEVSGKQGREFCEKYLGLVAELASSIEAKGLQSTIAGLQTKIEETKSNGTVTASADPQAEVLAKLTGFDMEKVQMAMTIFIALLLEVGSGLGMYIAFSQWRLYEREAPAAPRVAPVSTAAVAVAAPVSQPAPAQIVKPRSGANDNKTAEVKPAVAPAPTQRLMAPENDVERFYKEKVENNNGSSVTATQLYEDYCAWCETKNKEPMALPTFGREFGELGVKKERIAGRVRYIGISLKTDRELEEDKKLTAFRSEAA